MRKNRKSSVLMWALFAVALLCMGGKAAAKEFYVREIDCSSAYRDPYNYSVRVVFNAEKGVKIPQKDQIAFDPPVEKIEIEHSWNDDRLDVYGCFKPQTSYKIIIKADVEDYSGNKLGHDSVFRFTVPRMRPLMDIMADGIFVPLGRKDWLIPLRLRNASIVTGMLSRIYLENLIAYDLDSFMTMETAEKIGEKTFEVKLPDNENVTGQLMLNGLLPMEQPGLYMLQLNSLDVVNEKMRNLDVSKKKLVVVTDIGATVCMDEDGRIQIAAVRLSDRTPVEGAEVTLYSQSNQVLKRGTTGKDGQVIMDCKSGDSTQNSEARVVTVKKDNDVTFVWIQAHSSYDFAFKPHKTDYEYGRNEIEGADAFVYMERGIARPGEEVVASAFVRDFSKKGQKPSEGFPCVMEMYGPTGEKITSVKMKSGEQGWLSHRFKLDESALTGNYRVDVAIEEGRVLGSDSFMVATYVPDNLRVQVSLDSQTVRYGDDLTGTVSAKYLYGADATDVRVKTNYYFSFHKPKHWKDYAVGNRAESKTLESVSNSYDKLGKKREIPLQWPEEKKSTIPQMIVFEATVMEPGGRGVTGTASAIVDFADWYLGIRKSQDDGENVVFDYKALASRSAVVPAFKPCKATVELKRIQWHYEGVERNGRFYNDWVCVKEPIDRKIEIDLASADGQFVIPDLGDGHYELVATVNESICTLVEFWHWQGEVGSRVSNPNVITFNTDKEDYRPGETATLTFESDDAGHAIVAHGPCGLDSGMTFSVKEGKNSFSVKIPENLQSERYYCGVTVVTGQGAKFKRVFGVAAVPVKLEKLKLNVALAAPEVARPGKPGDIEVALTDNDGKPVEGLAHVFLVDSGILSLTNFKTPDVFKHFHSPFHCGMSFIDIFSYFYPDMKIEGAVNIGGGAAGFGAALKEKMQTLKTKKAAVVVLDAVKTGKDGKATLKVTLPEHLGAMRIMCVASADALLGSGEREMILRDEIDVLASGPRAVAPGDEFDCTFVLNNFDLPDGGYEFAATLPEGITADNATFKGELKKGGSTVCTMKCKAGERLGALDIGYTMSMKGFDKKGVLHINVRSANPPVAENASLVVMAGERRTLQLTAKDWLAGSASGIVTTATSPVTGLTDCLEWLGEYPHGCLEQTTSCAFPFLCLPQLREAGIIDENELKTHEHKLDAARRRIQTMYLGEGKFSLWPGSETIHFDAGVYASHFLFALNARRELNSRWLDAIEKRLNGIVEDTDYPSVTRAYCCYILSYRDTTSEQKAKACVAAARNILKGKSNGMETLLASAALVKSGNASEGMPRFRKCLEEGAWLQKNPEVLSFSNEESCIGMVLTMVMDLMPEDKVATTIAVELNRRLRPSGDGWGTTQANAWACMGLASYAAHYKGADANGTIRLNEQAEKAVEKGVHKISMKMGDRVEIVNTGKTPLYVNFRQKGIRRAPLETESRGVSIRRQYLNKDGVSVHHAKQGDLLKVRLTLSSVCDMGDMVVTDLLPGCLEIEDSRLATRASNSESKASKTSVLIVNHKVRLTHFDGRDDRYLAYFDIGKGVWEIEYNVRAVSKGKFTIPPSIIEAMYQPDFRGSYAEDGMMIVE